MPLFALSDEQAMRRVQRRNDSQAFALLVRRWEQPIQRLCLQMTGNIHRAEDVAQETFAQLFLHRSQYRGESQFSTFLWRIAANRCLNERRSVERRRESSLDDESGQAHAEVGAIPSPTMSPNTVVENEERAEIVRQALLRLPETHRIVVVLRHYENLKFREIADALDLPEGTVKSRMADALTQLARWLSHLREPVDIEERTPHDASRA